MARVSKQVRAITVNRLTRELNTGKTTIEEIQRGYNAMREKAMSRIRRIKKSEIPFFTAEAPKFATVKQLKDTRALIHEYADLQRFISSPRSTVTGRKKIREKALASLSKHGVTWVNNSNYLEFVDFIQWFNESEYSARYDSNDNVVEDVANAVANTGLDPEELFKFYEEWRKSTLYASADFNELSAVMAESGIDSKTLFLLYDDWKQSEEYKIGVKFIDYVREEVRKSEKWRPD